MILKSVDSWGKSRLTFYFDATKVNRADQAGQNTRISWICTKGIDTICRKECTNSPKLSKALVQTPWTSGECHDSSCFWWCFKIKAIWTGRKLPKDQGS